MNSETQTYVVVTPARNEEAFIAETAESMAAQTIKPLCWVVVSDGSTDRTDEIVRSYAVKHDWIKLIRMPDRNERHFAGKVHAFNAGYDVVRNLPHDYLVSLDADISFGPDYLGFLLGKIAGDPKLGLVGTPFRENGRSYDYRFVSIEHVSGACQVFRRECFEEIGGFVPSRSGGVDHIAVLTARLKGWKTRTFTEHHCAHQRKIGTAQCSPLKAQFRVGVLDYALGGHPVWELFRGGYQISRKPLILGGLMILAGYAWSMVRRVPRPISEELVRFRRKEQMRRLRKFLLGQRSVAQQS